MSSCKLVAITKPVVADCDTAEDLIAYIARVSNPANQANKETSGRLLKYLVRNQHWSPFEQVSLTIEIETTRDIGRQILRHRSFVFQEFSQRYAEVLDFSDSREARLQDSKNRQNSIQIDDPDLEAWWFHAQDYAIDVANENYQQAIRNGLAKEQARVVLPEGLTMSRMYMTGNLRNWIHYCQLRRGNGTQKEHREIADACWAIVLEQFPSLAEVLPDRDEFDDLVDAFAAAMKSRLREKKELGYSGWDDPEDFTDDQLDDRFQEETMEPWNPIDVANFAAFRYWRDSRGE